MPIVSTRRLIKLNTSQLEHLDTRENDRVLKMIVYCCDNRQITYRALIEAQLQFISIPSSTIECAPAQLNVIPAQHNFFAWRAISLGQFSTWYNLVHLEKLSCKKIALDI